MEISEPEEVTRSGSTPQILGATEQKKKCAQLFVCSQGSRRSPPPQLPKYGTHEAPRPRDVWIYKEPRITHAKLILCTNRCGFCKHTHANTYAWLKKKKKKLSKVARSRPGLAGAGECKQVRISLVSFQWKDSELNIT